jgi:hypothetical protein
MQSPGSAQEHRKVYEKCRLIDPRTDIRLLRFIDDTYDLGTRRSFLKKIDTYDHSLHFRCSLTIKSLARDAGDGQKGKDGQRGKTCLSYAAISYTWGEPSDTTWIYVNDIPVTIRKNCHYALWQIRRQLLLRRPAYAHFWIDSLCINQADVEEKSAQVSMMADIYERAFVVYACIGPPADGSESLVRFLLEIDKLEGDILEETNAHIDQRGMLEDGAEYERFKSATLRKSWPAIDPTVLRFKQRGHILHRGWRLYDFLAAGIVICNMDRQSVSRQGHDMVALGSRAY